MLAKQSWRAQNAAMIQRMCMQLLCKCAVCHPQAWRTCVAARSCVTTVLIRAVAWWLCAPPQLRPNTALPLRNLFCSTCQNASLQRTML